MADFLAEDNSDWLSVAQAAKFLGITRQRVHNLIKNRQILAHKLGRYYYIKVTELARYKDQPTGKPYQRRTTNSQANSIDK